MDKKNLIILLLFISIAGLSFSAWDLYNGSALDLWDVSNNERVNILLLGADARTSDHNGYTDSITILSIDKKTKQTYILSIPRDTMAQVPGRGWVKINSAYAYGDINTTKTAVENLLNVRIDYYALVDFNSFKQVVDTLGGINMYVDPHISAVRPKLNGKTGMCKVTGSEALILVRFRQDSESEGGRMKRHREAIKAIIDEILEPSNILKLPTVLTQLRENVKTDIPALETTVIEKLLNGFDLENAKIEVVPGNYTYINGENSMIPDMNKTEAVIVELGLRK
ncbi:LCP family protein [Methanobacterium alcaliphilum]|uniref:LCP family protein n=1 Tax=Methanobacterium alcaliphilum TaxID=392018 RepID=UPI002009FD59|nr:LCP family protein [Methanobacterium alcaliphilum]MCK9151789.1 LCP family protein [Methanobacterium alcaliphilum]